MSFSKREACRMVMGIIMFVMSGRLRAQQKITLDSIANAAVKYMPVLKQKQAYINAAEAGLTATRHDFLPRLKFSEQLNMGSDNSLAGSYFTFGITPSTSAGVRTKNDPEPETGNLAIVYGEYDLYNFGLNKARLNNAKANISLQAADYEKEQYFLELQVARYYFSILKLQYRLIADQQNIYRYDSIFTVIRALSSSGIRPGSDSSAAKAELSKARVNYNQTLGDLLQLRDELGYLTGLPPASIVTDTAAFNPAMRKIQNDTTVNASGIPLINYYLSKRKTFEANEQVIRKSFLPKITLAASTWGRGSSIQYNDNYKSLGYGLGYQRFNYLAGVAFTYNLFNSLYKKDQLAINQFQLQASDDELQQQTLAVELASRKADHAMQTAYADYQEIPIQVRSANDTYRQKVAQYKAGLISLIDLTNASFVLYRSQIDYAEGLTNLFQAKLDKAAATGNLFTFIQSFN